MKFCRLACVLVFLLTVKFANSQFQRDVIEDWDSQGSEDRGLFGNEQVKKDPNDAGKLFEENKYLLDQTKSFKKNLKDRNTDWPTWTSGEVFGSKFEPIKDIDAYLENDWSKPWKGKKDNGNNPEAGSWFRKNWIRNPKKIPGWKKKYEYEYDSAKDPKSKLDPNKRRFRKWGSSYEFKGGNKNNSTGFYKESGLSQFSKFNWSDNVNETENGLSRFLDNGVWSSSWDKDWNKDNENWRDVWKWNKWENSDENEKDINWGKLFSTEDFNSDWKWDQEKDWKDDWYKKPNFMQDFKNSKFTDNWGKNWANLWKDEQKDIFGKDFEKNGWGKDLGKDWGKDMGKDWGKDLGKDWGKDLGKDLEKDWGKDLGKDWGKDWEKDLGKDWGKNWGKDWENDIGNDWKDNWGNDWDKWSKEGKKKGKKSNSVFSDWGKNPDWSINEMWGNNFDNDWDDSWNDWTNDNFESVDKNKKSKKAKFTTQKPDNHEKKESKTKKENTKRSDPKPRNLNIFESKNWGKELDKEWSRLGNDLQFSPISYEKAMEN